MFEAHGWAVLRSDTYESNYLANSQLAKILRERLEKEFREPLYAAHVEQIMNELIVVTISGSRNHCDERIIELFAWIGQRSPGA